MSSDVVRFEGNERVDLVDLLAAVDETLRANARDWGTNFLADPAGDRSWILDGFATDNADGSPFGGTQVRVTKGRAILGQREGGQTIFGALTSEGDATRIIDIGSFSAGTYGVYVRFELLSGESSSRAFWDPTGDGEEIAQTIPTRRLANWSVRVELMTPGAEWLRVSTVVIDAAPVVTGITDLRDLYFEGTVDGTYASGWSTEGGGVANDRSSDRQQYGVSDLHTFTQAMRQCLEDIKGRGLRRWWQRDIGGMNVGFDAAPVEAELAVGDADFMLNGSTIATPTIVFDANDEIRYERVSDTWEFYVGGVREMVIGGDYLWIVDGGFVMDGTTIATPRIAFDVNDSLRFIRSTNHWEFLIGGSPSVVIEEDTPGSPAVRALDPAASSDDGGDLFFVGGASGADADKPGGNAIISGGQSTGDEASQVIIQAATKGSSGSAVRAPETYLTCHGDGGSEGTIIAAKPLVVFSTVASEPAAKIESTTDFGLYLKGKTIAPTRAVLGLEAQDDDASSPVGGSLYPNSRSQQLAYYSGISVPARFQNLDALIKTLLVDSDPIVSTASEKVFEEGTVDIEAEIPANTLRVGTKIRLYGSGIYGITATPTMQLDVRLNGLAGDQMLNLPAFSAFAAGGRWEIFCEMTIRSLGLPGSIVSGGNAKTGPPGPAETLVGSPASVAIDTTAINKIGVSAQWGTSSASNTILMRQFSVEVR